MSILHINQIQQKIRDLFIADIDTKDIKPTDKEKEHKIITRCLAAYAIYSTAECSAKEAALSVVDGGDDNGIDAIYYSPLNKRMFIVQSKFCKSGAGEPSNNDIAKLCRGVSDSKAHGRRSAACDPQHGFVYQAEAGDGRRD